MADVADPIRAAGAVVWQPGPRGRQLVLVHRPRYDDWSFPKGKAEHGEHLLRTAVREVAEETGLRVVLGRPLRPSVYQVGDRPKRVSYWAAKAAGSDGFVAGHEVDELAWLDLGQVRERLSYERDLTLLEEFESGPVGSVPFIMLRHASAGLRQAGAASAADLARPLDARGEADAELLAVLLASYGRCRVVSSPAERCLATVRPYAQAVGVPVEIDAALTVGSDRAAAARRAVELTAAGEPVIVCAHRENLPAMLEAACASLHARLPAGPPLAKGCFVVLQCTDGVLISSERHDLSD
ncbi:MAG TPA: NUDIX hydrolase [Streptosporangiaceae bacterium]|jgi:8-oxo-(d)GTP phosphatase|nr:NUDIX hydrolase [Streptosporangiaceae bacterium]